MDDYELEKWNWESHCTAIDDDTMICPRCGYIMLPQFQHYEYMGAGWEEYFECTNATCGYCCKI